LFLSDATHDTERLCESNYSTGDVNAGSPIFVLTNVIGLLDCQIPGYDLRDQEKCHGAFLEKVLRISKIDPSVIAFSMLRSNVISGTSDF
jgi:hypothetical protein